MWMSQVSAGILAVHLMRRMQIYVGKSINELQIQAATHIFELSAGDCHR